MNKLNTTLGSYMPSFFTMELSFPFYAGRTTLWNLSERNLSIFVHEYIHFLQDISTYVGLNNAYVYSEQIHGLVSTIYQKPKGQIKIPVEMPYNYGNILLNRFVNEGGFGYLGEINDFFLVSIKKKMEKVRFQNNSVKYLTKIILKSIKGKQVEFGSRAIMESMAYLIEKEITKGSCSAKDYPYNIAEIVAEYLYSGFANDKLRLIALCDASMLFSEPGKIFVQSLENFKKQNILPNAYQIVDHFYSCPCIQMGKLTNIIQGIINMGMMVGERLNLYLQGPNSQDFQIVIEKLLGFGINFRMRNRYFILDLVRGGYVLNNALFLNTIRAIGTPIIKDVNDDFWLIPPLGMSTQKYRIDYFPAVEQIYKCLAEGCTICEMLPWCERSPHVNDDNRCYDEPWSRVHDANLCPYAMLWKHWNLDSYIPKE